MKSDIEADLRECLKYISADWKMQTNFRDKETRFIYDAESLADCLEMIEKHKVDKSYALHRWYNYMTSVRCEQIFCEYGAKHCEDEYNHDVDIYINSVPFDVKLTVYPAKLQDKPFDLSVRSGKDGLIRWFYLNQSQQSRKQLSNRLYVVCDGENPEERLRMKSDFPLLRRKIKAFMDFCALHGLNRITIDERGEAYFLYSDIIYIANDTKS